MVVIVGSVLLVGAVVLFLLQPLLTDQRASLEREEDEMTDAEARRRVKLLALRDVEYDYATGKLDASDYRDLRRELSAEALAALDEVERENVGRDERDAAIEAEIRRVREGLGDGTTCEACGHRNPGGSRFCSICGASLTGSAGNGG